MSKPGVDPTFGISSGDVLIPTERHPACRRREARPGSGVERENLAGDAKGKGASGSNREAKSTEAPERGGLPRGSDEGSVMELSPQLPNPAPTIPIGARSSGAFSQGGVAVAAGEAGEVGTDVHSRLAAGSI